MSPTVHVWIAAVSAFIGGLIVGATAMIEVMLKDRKRKTAKEP